MSISQKRLKELLTYRRDGTFVWKVTMGSRAPKGAIAGVFTRHGYIRIRLDGKDYYAHRLAWLYVHGVMPNTIDHFDGDGLNNKIRNLRDCTQAENTQNRSASGKRSNACGYIGVSWSTSNNKWRADIAVNKKKTLLGYFDSPKKASDAYQAAKRSAHIFHPELTR